MILTVNDSRPFLMRPTEDCDPTAPETQETIDALLAAVVELDAKVSDSRVAGLAANQIGHGLSVFVARLTPDSDELTVCINPTLIYHYTTDATLSKALDQSVGIEACYSHPGDFYAVRRHQHVTASWFDTAGTSHIKRFSGLHAIILQHETDHLNGELISGIGKKVVPVLQDPSPRSQGVLVHV